MVIGWAHIPAYYKNLVFCSASIQDRYTIY